MKTEIDLWRIFSPQSFDFASIARRFESLHISNHLD